MNVPLREALHEPRGVYYATAHARHGGTLHGNAMRRHLEALQAQLLREAADRLHAAIGEEQAP